MRVLEGKHHLMQRDLDKRNKECSDLEFEKRGKERQFKNASSQVNGGAQEKDSEIAEKQLQREVREKEEELERLKQMIRDKKIDIEGKKTFGTGRDKMEPGEQQQYDKLSKEIDSVKVMMLDLRASQAGVDM